MKKVFVATLLIVVACFSVTPSYAEFSQAKQEEILLKHQESLLAVSAIADQLEKIGSFKAKILKTLENREQYTFLFGPDAFEVNVKLAEVLYNTSVLEREAQKAHQEAVHLAAALSSLKGIIYGLQGLDYLKGKSLDNGKTYRLTDQELAQVNFYSREALRASMQAVELDPGNRDYRKTLHETQAFWGQFKKNKPASANFVVDLRGS